MSLIENKSLIRAEQEQFVRAVSVVSTQIHTKAQLGAVVQSFDPNAIDGDGDGIVQDGSPFERPAVISAISKASQRLGQILSKAKQTKQGRAKEYNRRYNGMSAKDIAADVVPDSFDSWVAKQYEVLRLERPDLPALTDDVTPQQAKEIARALEDFVEPDLVWMLSQDDADKYKELKKTDRNAALRFLTEGAFDFSPQAVAKNRRLIEHTLTTNPQFRELVNRFGMPTLTMYGPNMTKDHMAAGFFSERNGISLSSYRNPTSSGKVFSAVSRKLGNWFMTGIMTPDVGSKDTKRWLVREGSPESLLVHEYGHYLSDMIGRTLPEDEKWDRSSGKAMAWRFSYGSDWKETFEAVGWPEAYDEYSLPLVDGTDVNARSRKKRDRREVPSNIPHILTGYGESSPSEAWAESISAIIAHGGEDKDLVSEGMTWLIRDALDLPDNDIRESLTPKRATREIIPDGFASRGATVQINNEKDPRFGEITDPYELTAEVLGTLDGDDPVGKMVRRLQEMKDDPEQYGRLVQAGNADSVDVPLNIRAANEAEAALLAEVLITDPAFADMIRRHGIPNFYFSQTDLKLKGDFDVRGILSGGYVADDSPNGKFYPARIVIDLIGAPHERQSPDTPFEPDSRADVQEYSKGRAPGNITRKFVSRSDKHVIRHEGGHGVLDQLWERQYEGKIKGRRAQLIRAYSKPTWEEFYKELGRPDLWAEHQRALRATYPSQQGTVERAIRRVIPGNPNISDEVQQVDSAYAWSNPKEMFAEGFSAYTSSNPAFRGLLNDTMLDHLQSILGDADTDIPEPPSMPESRDLDVDAPEPPAWDGFASTGAPITSYSDLRSDRMSSPSGNGTFTRRELFENTTTEQKLDLAVPTNERDWALMAWDERLAEMGVTWDDVKRIDLSDPFKPKIPKDLREGKEFIRYVGLHLKLNTPDFSPENIQANREALRAALDGTPRFRSAVERHGLPPIATMTNQTAERLSILGVMDQWVKRSKAGEKINPEILDILPAYIKWKQKDTIEAERTGQWNLFRQSPEGIKAHQLSEHFKVMGGYSTAENTIILAPSQLDKWRNGTRLDHQHSPEAGDWLIADNSVESILLHEFSHHIDYSQSKNRGSRADNSSFASTLEGNRLFAEVDKHIKTRYGRTQRSEFAAESIAAVLSGSRDQEEMLSPEARRWARSMAGLPENDPVFTGRTRTQDDLVTRYDQFGHRWTKLDGGDWKAPFYVSRSRDGVPDVIESMAEAKERTGLTNFEPVVFEHDGRTFTTRQVNDTFSIEINGRTVATANVVENQYGMPEIQNVDVLPGYTGVAADKDLHEMVVDHARKKYPSALAPRGTPLRVRQAAIHQDGFASVGPEHHDARQIDGTAGTPEYAQAVAGEFEAAQANGKKVFFDYNGETREVEVTEVFTKNGILYMRGNDALRNGEERMFRLDRVSMPKRVENPDTGAAEVVKKPGKPPRKPVPVFTGKAAELFEGAASWEEVAARLGKGRYVFFDFETTGIEEDEFGGMKHPGTPTQIGLTEIVDGKITRQWSTHVNPGRPLSIDPKTGRSWSADNLKYKDPDTGELVNISDEWLAQQKQLSEALDEMLEFIGPIEDTILGGQNHPYDDDVMKRAMADAGLDPARWNPGGFIDSQALAQALLDKSSDDYPKNEKGTKTVSLGYLATFLGHDMGEGWHSADADAEASYESFKRLIDRAALHENSGKPVRRDLFAPGGALKEHQERLDDYERQVRGYDYKVKRYKEQAAAATESPATEGFASRGAKKILDLVKERRRAKDPTAWKNLKEKEKQRLTKESADRAIFMINELSDLGYDAESLKKMNRADLDGVFLDLFPDGSVRVSDSVTANDAPLVQVNSATMGKVFMALGFHVEVVSSDPNEKFILENGINDMQKALQDYVAAAASDPARLKFDAVFKNWAANVKDANGDPKPIDVSTLGTEGGMSYADAAKLFAETFEINLCLYYTTGVNMLCGSNIGIERVEMPQVSGRSMGDDTYATRSIKAGLAAAKEIAIDKKKLAELKDRDPELHARVLELLDKEALAKLGKDGKPDPKFEIKNAAALEEVRKLAQAKDPLAKALFDVMNWNNTEADAVPIMDRAAKALGINVGETEFKDPTTLLGAQNELQGSKVEGMADGAVAAVLEALEILRARFNGREPTQDQLMDYLANEIKHGLFQPVLTAGNEGMQRYLVDGHHRWAGLIVANKKLKEMGLDVQVLLNTKNYETDIRSALEIGKVVQTFIGIKDAKLSGEDKFVPDPNVPELTAKEFDAAIEALIDQANLIKEMDLLKAEKKYRKKAQYGTELDVEAAPQSGLIPKRKLPLSEAVQMAIGQNATLEPQSRVTGVKPQSTGYRALDSGMKWTSVEDHVQIETDRGNPLFDTYKEYVDGGYEVAWVTHDAKEAGRYAISADQVNAFDRDEISVDPANIGEVDLAGAELVGKDDEGGFLYARKKPTKATRQRIETLKSEEEYLDGFASMSSYPEDRDGRTRPGDRYPFDVRPSVFDKETLDNISMDITAQEADNVLNNSPSFTLDERDIKKVEAAIKRLEGMGERGKKRAAKLRRDLERRKKNDEQWLERMRRDMDYKPVQPYVGKPGDKPGKFPSGSSFPQDEPDWLDGPEDWLDEPGDYDGFASTGEDDGFTGEVVLDIVAGGPHTFDSDQRRGPELRDREVVADDWKTRQQKRIAGVRVPERAVDENGAPKPGAPIYRETVKIGRKQYTFEVDSDGIVSVYTGRNYKQVAQLNLDRGHSMEGSRRSENPSRHFIDMVMVDRKHRRKGIATYMAEMAEYAYGGKVEHSTALTSLGKKWRDADVEKRGATALPLPKDFDPDAPVLSWTPGDTPPAWAWWDSNGNTTDGFASMGEATIPKPSKMPKNEREYWEKLYPDRTEEEWKAIREEIIRESSQIMREGGIYGTNGEPKSTVSNRGGIYGPDTTIFDAEKAEEIQKKLQEALKGLQEKITETKKPKDNTYLGRSREIIGTVEKRTAKAQERVINLEKALDVLEKTGEWRGEEFGVTLDEHSRASFDLNEFDEGTGINLTAEEVKAKPDFISKVRARLEYAKDEQRLQEAKTLAKKKRAEQNTVDIEDLTPEQYERFKKLGEEVQAAKKRGETTDLGGSVVHVGQSELDGGVLDPNKTRSTATDEGNTGGLNIKAVERFEKDLKEQRELRDGYSELIEAIKSGKKTFRPKTDVVASWLSGLMGKDFDVYSDFDLSAVSERHSAMVAALEKSIPDLESRIKKLEIVEQALAKGEGGKFGFISGISAEKRFATGGGDSYFGRRASSEIPTDIAEFNPASTRAVGESRARPRKDKIYTRWMASLRGTAYLVTDQEKITGELAPDMEGEKQIIGKVKPLFGVSAPRNAGGVEGSYKGWDMVGMGLMATAARLEKEGKEVTIESVLATQSDGDGFASRGGTGTTIMAQSVAGTKARRGYKKLQPRYFKTEDGEQLELYHSDSTTNTFMVRLSGKGVARVSVIEDSDGLPQITVMNIQPGYDAAQIESELTKYVKEYFPDAKPAEGKARVVKTVKEPGFASRGNYQPLPTPGDDDGFSPGSTLEKLADEMGLDQLPDGRDQQMSAITGRMYAGTTSEATLAEKLGITPEQLREQIRELAENVNDFVDRFVNDKTVRKQVKLGYKAISLAAMLLGMKGMKDYMSLLNPNFSGGGDGSGKSNSLLDIIDDMLGSGIHEALIAYGSNFANLIATEYAAMRLATQEKVKQMIADIQARIEGTGQKIGVMSTEMWNRLRGAWKLTRAKAPIAVPASAKQWIVAGSTPAWAEMAWIDYQSKSRVTSGLQPTNIRAWADIVSKVGQSPELIDIATYRAGFGYGTKRIKSRDVVRVYLIAEKSLGQTIGEMSASQSTSSGQEIDGDGDGFVASSPGGPDETPKQKQQSKPKGQLEKGNINLTNRPIVQNSDGSISTVRSITITDGKIAVLIPSVIRKPDGTGKVVGNNEAIKHYRKTGEHLGKFNSVNNANSYAEQLHKDQEKRYVNPVATRIMARNN